MNSPKYENTFFMFEGAPKPDISIDKIRLPKDKFSGSKWTGKEKGKNSKTQKTMNSSNISYKYCFPILEGHLILRPTACNEDISGIWNFKKLITKLLSVGNSEQTINKFNRNGSIPSSQSALRYSFQRDHPTLQRLLACCGNDSAGVFGVQVVKFFWVVKRGCVMRMIKCYPNDEPMQKGVCVCFSKFSRSVLPSKQYLICYPTLLGKRFGARDDVFSY